MDGKTDSLTSRKTGRKMTDKQTDGGMVALMD